MESDDLSNSRPVQVKLGLQNGVSHKLLKPRVRRMGAKEMSKETAIGVDSDDDEPIGALLKLKRAQKAKKVKVVEAKAEKLVVEEDESFEGMDDTLASFRKKLKGPKKDIGSASAARPLEDVKKGCNERDGLLDVRADRGLHRKHRENVRKLKVDMKSVQTKADAAVDGDLEGLLTQSALLEAQTEYSLLPEGCPDLYSDERLEDSLSASFQKKPSGSMRKSLSVSSLEQDNGAQYSEDKLNPTSGVLEVSKSVVHENHSQVVSSSRSFSSTSELTKEEKDQRFDNSICQASNLMEENSDVVQKLSSFPVMVDDAVRSHDKIHDRFSKNICKLPAPVSQPSVFQDGEVKDESMLGSCVPDVKEESSREPCSSHRICTEDCPAPGQNDLFGTQTLKNALKVEETCFGHGSPDSHSDKPNSVFFPQKETSVIANGRQSPKSATSYEVLKSGFDLLTNKHKSSVETCDHLNKSSAFIQRCSSDLHENLHSDYASKADCVPCDDYHSYDEEANGTSSPSRTPGESTSYPEDAVQMLDSEFKDGKLSAVHRAVRKAKRRRLGDMAYEGDADWEILINEQQFMECDQGGDSDRAFRTRDRSDSSSVSGTEAENGGTAAVSAGLKARAASPVEKIKFKEILKRKGGLQEYLECRNRILSLWSKDVSRILPLADCGVADTPSEVESPRTSLIRQIYSFLDQSGYINIGIASEKEKTEPSIKHHCKLLEEKKFEGNLGASIADLEDGVSFILGQVKSSEASLTAENGVATDVEIPVSKETENTEQVAPVTLQFSNIAVSEELSAENNQETRSNGMKVPSGQINLSVLDEEPSSATMDSRAVCAVIPDSKHELQSVRSNSFDDTGGTHDLHWESKERKNIIVIGAGPAGLIGARHLQRQGCSVTVLEARGRIGGRVYTDRSSLSVPVDLGASIITGVEADVDTERRPDPSSLICAQLGLELTVLNSDCPLYDIVTGDKVPADLDEALEAEYNSLLDDMVLVITQKGEHAMKMSLEDGLEYALKRRRMLQSGTDISDSKDSEICSDGGGGSGRNCSGEEILSPLERRVMDWHFAHLEYGCAALLKEVSLPYWNQDDVYGGFGGAHCMIKGGYSNVVESLAEGLLIKLNHVVTDISYSTENKEASESQCKKVKVSTSNGSEFLGDAVLITIPLGCLKSETIKFSPPLPPWKHSSIQRLGFGVLNKVVLEFPEVFWDDSVDYFGATAEETNRRGHCFMFWNVKKTVGAPVLIALVVGKAAVDGQSMRSYDHVKHALMVLRKLFGEASVPDPVASVVTDWGRDPFAYGAYSYVAIGSSGEDYDILGRPVENCLFFAGEATCKEHPDTVGGAMMSGLREAVRIIDLLHTGHDVTAEAEAMELSQRHSECERDEVRDITKRLEAVELSNVMYKNSLDRSHFLTREALLQDMFFHAKTTAGRLLLAKMLLNLPVESLKSFAGTRKGLATLNSWILDSMGKDGTQLLRHCVRLLVLVSTDLLAVRLSGIGKTVKEKVCVHTSRDIRAIASQLVNVWLEVFRKEKAANGRLKLSRQSNAVDSSKRKSVNNSNAGKPPLRTPQVSVSTGKLESRSHGQQSRPDDVREKDLAISKEEQAALAAAEAAFAAARAAAEAYASSEAQCNTYLQLPKIPSFHKFARREQYAQMDESDLRKKWSGGVLGRQDCISEIDSRNCRVRDWSVDFSAACPELDTSRMSVDNLSQRSNSNDIPCHINFREQSGESVAVDNSLLTKVWVDSGGSARIKDHHAIERWQSQAAAAESDFYHSAMHINEEEDSNTSSKPRSWKHDGQRNESSVSQVTIHKEPPKSHRGADHIKQAVIDFVASLLMPVYKARKIDREGYKSIMKKSATKVMEQATDVEKAMAVSQFLDFKRKNKIRAFVDKLIERHMEMKPTVKP